MIRYKRNVPNCLCNGDKTWGEDYYCFETAVEDEGLELETASS